VRPNAFSVGSITGFAAGQTITIDSGANEETAVVAAVAGGRGGAFISVASPLRLAHAAGAQISGSGITLTTALSRAHTAGAQIGADLPTAGTANTFSNRRR
jgi:hypothetical protein